VQDVGLIREFCRLQQALQQAEQRACDMLLDAAQTAYARIWNAATRTEQQTFFSSLGIAEFADAVLTMDDTGTCLPVACA